MIHVAATAGLRVSELVGLKLADVTFRDRAVMTGVAVNRHGHPEASMGLAVGDVDADGRADLFMTHLALEHNTLYLRDAGQVFAERTVESRLSEHDLALTGFGCALFDLEHDGDLDLAVVNGRVRRDASESGSPRGSGTATLRPTCFWATTGTAPSPT